MSNYIHPDRDIGWLPPADFADSCVRFTNPLVFVLASQPNSLEKKKNFLFFPPFFSLVVLFVVVFFGQPSHTTGHHHFLLGKPENLFISLFPFGWGRPLNRRTNLTLIS